MKPALLLACICLGLLAPHTIAGEQKDDLYSQLNRAIIRLEHREVQNGKGSAGASERILSDGTAFFVISSMNGNTLFVVSARHVVEKPYDLRARVQCRNNQTGGEEVILLELPRGKWTFHNNHGDKDTEYVDVAVMRIPGVRDRLINYFRYEPRESPAQDRNQLPLQDAAPPQPVLVFGFPADVGFQLLEQKPMGRLGIISMKTDKKFIRLASGKFAEERCCLIDARIFPGNSGSPVMNQLTATDSEPRLLGLVKATNAALEFSVIEPVSRIRETLDLAKDKPVSGVWKLIGQ